MEFGFSISQQDLLEAQKRHAGAFGKISSIIGALLMSFGVFAGVSGSAPFGSAIIPVFVGFCLAAGPRVRAHLAFKQDFANHPEVTASISESGIRLASARGVSEIFWPAIMPFEETANMFILYTQSNAFQLIPKRATTSETLPILQTALKAHLEKVRLVDRRNRKARLVR